MKQTCQGFPALVSACEMTARIVLGRSRNQCANFVERMLQKEHAVIFTKNSLYIEIIQTVQANLESTKAATSLSFSDMSSKAQSKDRSRALTRFEKDIGTVDLTEVTDGSVTDEFRVCMHTTVDLDSINCKDFVFVGLLARWTSLGDLCLGCASVASLSPCVSNPRKS